MKNCGMWVGVQEAGSRAPPTVIVSVALGAPRGKLSGAPWAPGGVGGPTYRWDGPRTFLEAVWEGTALGRALGFVPSFPPAVGVKIKRRLKKKKKEKSGGRAS